MAEMTWILVADGSRARVFESANGADITEIASFANPEGRSQDGELASYDEGMSARVAPRSGPEQPSAREHRVAVFAKDLARHLEQARIEHRYRALYLFAAPGFLGRLRQNLSKDVENLVAEAVDKDISWFNAPDIERYIKRRLAPRKADRL